MVGGQLGAVVLGGSASTSATPPIRCHLSADDPRAGLVAAVGEDGAADPLGVEALEVLRVVSELGAVDYEAGEEDGGGRAGGRDHCRLLSGPWRLAAVRCSGHWRSGQNQSAR